MSGRPALLPLSLLLAFVAVAPARGEIYRWRDAAGREHFTTELGQVPARHRAAAKTRQAQGGGYSKTPGPERSGKTDEDFAAAYAAANRFAFRRHAADATKGSNEIVFELPPDLPIGFYHVRAYLQSASSSHMGSADFRVRLPEKD